MPGLQGQLTQFQTRLAGAIAVRNQLSRLNANLAAAFLNRAQILREGGDLYSRLSLALRSVHSMDRRALASRSTA